MGVVESATRLVDRVPLVGSYVAPYVAPAAIAAASTAALLYVNRYAEGYLPARAKDFSYSIGGVGSAAVVSMLPVGTRQGRNWISAGLVLSGFVIDAYRYMNRMGSVAAPAEADPAALAGIGVRRGFAGPDEGSQAYSDANLVDASAVGRDFAPAEGQELIRGQQAWWKRFFASRAWECRT